MMGKHKNQWIERLLHQGENREPLPLSLVLPVYNCSEGIGMTLESIVQQNYAPLEVIIVDAGSTDRTLEIINSYASLITRIYTVGSFNLTDMINRGITLATGTYVTFLFPGSYYLSPATYQTFLNSTEGLPDLLYCGSIQREVRQEPRTLFSPLTKELLQRGQQPASLPACWFRHDLFERVGKFDTRLALRPAFEFFCGLVAENGVQIRAIDRVFIDFDYGQFSYGKVLRYAAETWRIISHYFGPLRAFRWSLSINHRDMIKWLWRRFKEQVFKS